MIKDGIQKFTIVDLIAPSASILSPAERQKGIDALSEHQISIQVFEDYGEGNPFIFAVYRNRKFIGLARYND